MAAGSRSVADRFLALDLGASSGRAMLGELGDGDKLAVREVHRFPNGAVNVGGHLHWDYPRLLGEVHQGIRAAKTDLASIGVDTWGVDFGFLDRNSELVGLPYSYRDRRTEGAVTDFARKMSLEELYRRTGIQVLPFDTLFQLHSMVKDGSPELRRTRSLLLMADLINHSLTGVAASEFTLATTSHIYNPRVRGWDQDIIGALGLPSEIFQEIIEPGTVLGGLTQEACTRTGIGPVSVTAVACHDTGSAVAAVPAEGDDFAYISSGTWSLMGVEAREPVINDASLRYNITNEGGVGGTFRVLKNIAGLWLLQECRRAWEAERPYSYEELMALADGTDPLATVIDPDWAGFLNPPSMPEAIAEFCRSTGQRPLHTQGEHVRAILEGLALAYRHTLAQLEEAVGKRIAVIHIVGGGSRNSLLCQLTADATNHTVYAGPAEATAIGNLLMQAKAAGRIRDLTQLRGIVRNSSEIATYEPNEEEPWDEAYEKFREIRGEKD